MSYTYSKVEVILFYDVLSLVPWLSGVLPFILFRCLEYLCKYASEPHGINERDHHYHTPLHIAVTTNLPRHARRLLIAKVHIHSIVIVDTK